MSYLQLAYLHLASIFPAFLIATFLMLSKKGTTIHRLLGKIFMILMLFSAAVSLFMSAEVGPTLFSHFGFIHLLSIQVLYSVCAAYIAVKQGDIRRHKTNMILLYVGGLMIAGGLTLLPGRLLHSWFIA